jgi:hypothetical protein
LRGAENHPLNPIVWEGRVIHHLAVVVVAAAAAEEKDRQLDFLRYRFWNRWLL